MITMTTLLMLILVDLSALVNKWKAISMGLCPRALIQKSIPSGPLITFMSGKRTTILVILKSSVYY